MGRSDFKWAGLILKSNFIISCGLVDRLRGDREKLLTDLWDLFLAPWARGAPVP